LLQIYQVGSSKEINTSTGFIVEKNRLILALHPNDKNTAQQMDNLLLIKEYLKWRFQAKNLHGVHSPFLFQFMNKCLYQETSTDEFQEIEKLRSGLLKKREILEFIDPGAGSFKEQSKNQIPPPYTKKKIRDIARFSLQRKKFCRLFYRMIQYFQFNSVLELGTSLGITTCYLAKADPDAEILTIEGAAPVAKTALSVFEKLNVKNVRLMEGRFDDILPGIPAEKMFDMIIIDGNHRGDATLRYFSWCVKHIHLEGVVVVDDIRWSGDMYDAWSEINAHPHVTVTVDLFSLGLVFFNKRLSKENFKISF
jgi:predicted O-methyltransferase YrrM